MLGRAGSTGRNCQTSSREFQIHFVLSVRREDSHSWRSTIGRKKMIALERKSYWRREGQTSADVDVFWVRSAVSYGGNSEASFAPVIILENVTQCQAFQIQTFDLLIELKNSESAQLWFMQISFSVTVSSSWFKNW